MTEQQSEFEARALTTDEIQALVVHVLEVHPASGPQDVYKLAHQAIMGPGHLLVDEDVTRMTLTREASALEMEPLEWESPIEIIHPGSEMARVHLRPYLRSGGSVQRLVKAMFKTQQIIAEPPAQSLAQLLGGMRQVLAASASEVFDLEAFDALLKEQVGKGFEAVHHSEAYREAYDPHYRVVLLDALAP